jgi:hypothetical protein
MFHSGSTFAIHGDRMDNDMMLLRMLWLLLPLFVSFGLPLFCLGFSVNHNDDIAAAQRRLLPGIWKLWVDAAAAVAEDGDILSFLQSQQKQKPKQVDLSKEDDDDDDHDDERSLLIKLNPDGSFRQCTENYQEGRWLSGQWKLVRQESNDLSTRSSSSSTTHSLLLALDRQYYGPRTFARQCVVDEPSRSSHSKRNISRETASTGSRQSLDWKIHVSQTPWPVL